MKYLLRIFGKLLFYSRKIRRLLLRILIRPLFRKYGYNFIFDPDGEYSFNTIEVGDDVFIGSGAHFSATESKIIIGNKVMFGPNVSIRGGNHNTSVIGKFMFDIKVKLPQDDQPVVIEDDVWVGTGAIILKGVRIGRGSIVGAGSVVTKNVPPYCVVAGSPARLIKYRWTIDQVLLHEESLYAPNQRLLEKHIGHLPDSLIKMEKRSDE